MVLVPSEGRVRSRGRTCYRLWSPHLWESELNPVGYADDSLTNEVRGLTRRLLMVTPPFDVGVAPALRTASNWVVRYLRSRLGSAVPITGAAVVGRYAGSKRRAYAEALASLQDRPLSRWDSEVELFVKAEKTVFPLKRSTPDPRVILARSKRYNIELLRYLVPIEGVLYGIESESWWGVPKGRVLAKGLNLEERAALLKEKFDQFADPVVVELDGSRWDGHVCMETLRLEHSVYKAVYPGDEDLARLLLWQESFRGRSSNGLRFTVEGKRCTGDANTGCGNSLLMLLFLRSAFKARRVKWTMLGDGDNVVLFLERGDVASATTYLVDWFRRCGQELTVDNKTSVFEEVTFCRMRPVQRDGTWVLTRPWTGVLGGALVSHRHYNEPVGARRMAWAVTTGEAIVSAGLPISGPTCEHLRGLFPRSAIKLDPRMGVYSQLKHFLGVDPDSAVRGFEGRGVSRSTRESFARAWGVEPEEQLRLEALFRTVTASDVDATRMRYGPVEACSEGVAWFS